MIKDIVLHVAVAERLDAAADYAVSTAEAFDAHLAGVAFAYQPVIPEIALGGVVPIDFIETQRLAAEETAGAAIAKFEEATRRSGISTESQSIVTIPAEAAAAFGRIARRFDLSIVGQADPEAPGLQDLIIEAALFQSGRPVVVVPYIWKAGLKLDRVLVGWDGSTSAARAVADAMPFLSRAKAIEIVVVATEPLKSDELPGADVAQHLARHDLKVELKRISSGDVDVANTLLSYAADASADFLVMGGYGHSRLREFILGGVTRGILSSMTVPALMSH